MRKLDVYVKDEGYAAVKFLTPRSKKWAVKNEIPNSLQAIGDTFCGKPVFVDGVRDGMYQQGFKKRGIKKLVKSMRFEGLVVESELE